MPDKTLDTKGLACPLPILKTKKALSELPKGAKLEVLATDPGSVPDFTAFCEFDRQCAARAQRAGRHLPLRHRASCLRRGHDGKDAVSRARRQRHEGVGAVPGHHDVRRADRRGARRSASSTTRVDSGVNFIDTANVYTEGRSEAVIGPAIKAKRDRWVLATKVAQSTGPNITDRGLSRRHLMQAVEASLKRLQTDHIDLYYIHRVDPDTAWEETDRRVRRPDPPGQDPRVGALQRRAWHIPHVHHLCRQLGVPQPAALQPYYNLMNRQPEVELLPAATRIRPRRRALQPARARRADRQVQGQPEGRARQPRRAPGPAHAGIGVAPREPDRRREAQGARREARHHAGGLGGRPGCSTTAPSAPSSPDRAPTSSGPSYFAALDYKWTAEDEKLADSLVAPGHASTPGFNDPAYPVEGRFAAVGSG